MHRAIAATGKDSLRAIPDRVSRLVACRSRLRGWDCQNLMSQRAQPRSSPFNLDVALRPPFARSRVVDQRRSTCPSF